MNSTSILKICVTGGALVLAVIHQWVPTFTLDAPTLVLLVIALLPWLQPLIKSVELLGVKLELQDLQDKVAAATGAAESAKQKAFFAQSATEPPISGTRPVQPTSVATEASLLALADQYDHIRDTQSAGDARTLAMTTLVHRIIKLAPHSQGFNLTAALVEKRRGVRLVAYAILYAAPDPVLLEALVQSVTTIEDKPFGQYWGLQAIARVIDAVPKARDLQPQAITLLREFGNRIPRGTDRDYELKQILEAVRGKT